MEMSKELRTDIELNQNQLRSAIRNHQILVIKLKADPDNIDTQIKIKNAQEDIIVIGLEQKNIIDRLRREIQLYQKTFKLSTSKIRIEDLRLNLNSTLNRARKQTILPHSGSVSSGSEDSVDIPSRHSSPEPPVSPYELTQADFLVKMGLCTHEVFKELQNKRVERKRRSTANPHFLYGSSRWDYSSKRKRNAYLLTANISPPNTRQSAKNKIKSEGPSPPLRSRPESPSCNKKNLPSGLNIPNLPSGLTIERINSKGSPDTKLCIACRASGNLSICETCQNGYHVSCHNRPLVQSPRHCPKCLNIVKKETSGSSSNALTVSFISQEYKEKTALKKELLSRNKTLKDELEILQERHDQLKLTVESQRGEQTDLKTVGDETQININRIVNFVTDIQKSTPNSVPKQTTITSVSSPVTITPIVPAAGEQTDVATSTTSSKDKSPIIVTTKVCAAKAISDSSNTKS